MRTSSSDTNPRVVYLCCPSLCRARALLAAPRWRVRARERERWRWASGSRTRSLLCYIVQLLQRVPLCCLHNVLELFSSHPAFLHSFLTSKNYRGLSSSDAKLSKNGIQEGTDK
ncbi:unnamed protein product [Caretta caretta]